MLDMEAIRAAFARDGEPDLGQSVAEVLGAAFGAPRHPLAGLDCEAMIREGRAAVAAMQARRQARYEQNASRREQAMQLYEAVRTAAYGAPQRDQEEFALTACAWMAPPKPITVW